MVEGPTARVYALKIEDKFKNETIRQIQTKTRRIYVSLNKILGRRLKKAETFGKNIVMFLDGFAIRVHLMMFGAIHIYGLDEPLLKPEKQVRLLLEGENRKLVVYNAPIVEIDKAEKIVGKLRVELGPDPLREDWDENEAVKRILQHKDEKIGIVLLDQRVIAGIGNILRNEILFRAKTHPEKLVRELSEEKIKTIVRTAKNLSIQFLELKLKKKRIKPILYVYNKYNKPCKVCGEKIKFYLQQPRKRKTFVCEKCQSLLG